MIKNESIIYDIKTSESYIHLVNKVIKALTALHTKLPVPITRCNTKFI